jgi:hypothetical protein
MKIASDYQYLRLKIVFEVKDELNIFRTLIDFIISVSPTRKFLNIS